MHAEWVLQLGLCWIDLALEVWPCRRCLPGTLTELSHLIPELGDPMLGVWTRCAGRKPALDLSCYLLGSVFCVCCLVQYFPILACSEMGDPVQVDATVSELS